MFSIVKLDSFLVIVNEENFSYIFQYLTRFNDRLWGGGGVLKGKIIQNVTLVGLLLDFMYRRILCTLYGAVDFLNVLKKYIMYL